jgi:thiol-disulfide isomerase/thioredoxin
MKKALASVLFLLPLLAAAQENYTLHVVAPAIENGANVFLIRVIENKAVRDSVAAKNGVVDFKGSIPEPCRAAIRTERDGKITDILQFYLEGGHLQIKSADSLRKAQVLNSPINKDAIAYNKDIAPFIQGILMVKMTAAKMSKDSLAGEPGKALLVRQKLLIDSIHDIQLKFIKSHPASFLSLEMLRQYAGIYIDVREITPMFNKLSKKIQSYPGGVAFAQTLAKAELIKIGNRAPQFVTATPAGDSLSLKQVLSQSKWVLVDFWASWCKPSRAENPNVVKAYEQYHEKGFNIISISLDKAAAPCKDAIAKDNMPWFHGSSLKGSEDATALAYQVGAIPDNFLLDANGVIIARGLRGSALEEKLQELSAKK